MNELLSFLNVVIFFFKVTLLRLIFHLPAGTAAKSKKQWEKGNKWMHLCWSWYWKILYDPSVSMVTGLNQNHTQGSLKWSNFNLTSLKNLSSNIRLPTLTLPSFRKMMSILFIKWSQINPRHVEIGYRVLQLEQVAEKMLRMHNHLSSKPVVYAEDFCSYRQNEEVNLFRSMNCIENHNGIYLAVVKMMQGTWFISATQTEETVWPGNTILISHLKYKLFVIINGIKHHIKDNIALFIINYKRFFLMTGIQDSRNTKKAEVLGLF